MAPNAKTITNKEYFYGHKACGGCGAALAIRLALKVLGDRAIAVIPPNCMSTVAFIYPRDHRRPAGAEGKDHDGEEALLHGAL